MHNIVKMGLSVGAAFLMNISLAFGMEKEDTSRGTVPSKLKDSPRIVSPFDFEGRISKDVRCLIVKQASYEQCLENKSPVNLALVCKEWRGIIVDEMQVGQSSWKAWYGVVGHEDIYERFLKGRLVYRPNEGSDEGKIELPIAALKNPLGSTFDLSSCGDTGKYLSIAIGYRKGKTPANADKVEVWFTPRFLVDKEMSQLAPNHHLRAIRENWNAARAPIAIFWTWGGWNAKDNMSYCDYLTGESMVELGSENLLKKYQKSGVPGCACLGRWLVGGIISHFVCELK